MSPKSRFVFYAFDRFEYTAPIETKGGIKAQTKRGAFGTSWWAKRWINVLESFNIGARLSRGRNYARKGQVLSIEIDKGKINATVQGSYSTPYKIKASVKMLGKADWNRVIKALSAQPLFTAKLLAGEMPQDIEKLFEELELSLFPSKFKDLKTDCDCPDWSNPCKHIAAVFYLLGEEFDRDPFLMFKMRGMSREEMLEKFPQMASSNSQTEHQGLKEEIVVPEGFKSDPALFWQGGKIPIDLFGEVNVPRIHATLPKRLGNFPFWRGQDLFLETLDSIYGSAAEQALDTFVGEID